MEIILESSNKAAAAEGTGAAREATSRTFRFKEAEIEM